MAQSARVTGTGTRPENPEQAPPVDIACMPFGPCGQAMDNPKKPGAGRKIIRRGCPQLDHTHAPDTHRRSGEKGGLRIPCGAINYRIFGKFKRREPAGTAPGAKAPKKVFTKRGSGKTLSHKPPHRRERPARPARRPGRGRDDSPPARVPGSPGVPTAQPGRRPPVRSSVPGASNTLAGRP
jgi:hypothetical protein